MIHPAVGESACEYRIQKRRRKMKKEYEAPKAEKLEFDYSETVVASGCGGSYRKHVDKYEGCRETPTDEWVHNFADTHN